LVVSENVAVCCSDPAVAVTVTVDVTGGGGAGDALLPHPLSTQKVSMPAASITSIWMRRDFFRPIQQRAAATITPSDGNSGLELWGSALALADTETVSAVVAAAPEGVTVAGENPHDAPACNPEQAKETAALKPFCGVTVTVVEPFCPETTVKAVGATEMEKVGAGAIPVTVRL
jgi:hypothetical protein